MRSALRAACLVVLLPAFARSAHAFNLDFGTAFGVPAASYGAASGQTGSWNQVGLGATALVGLGGAPSGASVSVTASTANGAYLTPTNNDQLLLDDNFYSAGGLTWTVSFSGLANGRYRVYLYAPRHPSIATGAMTVGGVPVASIPGDTSGTLIEGTSWVRVDASVSGGTLSISGSNPTALTGLAGLQLVRPPPALNIDFGLQFGTPAASYGAAAGQAGVWNQVGLGTTGLVGLAGSVSGVSVSVSAATDGGYYQTPTNNDQLLLEDNFFAVGGESWSATLSGLVDGRYRVYLYAPSNPLVPSGAMNVGGVLVASLPGSPGGSLIHGTSWASVDVTVAGGTLAITGAGATLSGLAGLQLVPLDQPALNLDFGTVYGTPATSYGAAAGQAGVWNLVDLGTTGLVNLLGASSGVSVAVSASTGTGAYVAPGNDDELLLNDNFFSSSGGSWSVSFSGLGNGDYAIYLYAPSNPVVPTGDVHVGAAPLVPSIPGDISSTLIEGTTWVRVVAPVTGGSLAISSAGMPISGLAGLQIVPLPEPRPVVQLASGAALLAGLACRRRRPAAAAQPTAPGSTRSPVRRTSASARRT